VGIVVVVVVVVVVVRVGGAREGGGREGEAVRMASTSSKNTTHAFSSSS